MYNMSEHRAGLLQDPSVMSAALCALHEVCSRDCRPFKNLVPSFVSILKQVRPQLTVLPSSICPSCLLLPSLWPNVTVGSFCACTKKMCGFSKLF